MPVSSNRIPLAIASRRHRLAHDANAVRGAPLRVRWVNPVAFIQATTDIALQLVLDRGLREHLDRVPLSKSSSWFTFLRRTTPFLTASLPGCGPLEDRRTFPQPYVGEPTPLERSRFASLIRARYTQINGVP